MPRSSKIRSPVNGTAFDQKRLGGITKQLFYGSKRNYQVANNATGSFRSPEPKHHKPKSPSCSTQQSKQDKKGHLRLVVDQ